MSVYPTNLLLTQLPIVNRILSRSTKATPTLAKLSNDQVNRSQLTSLLLYVPIRPLACPARFERATSALEEFVAAQKAIYFNSLQQKTGTV